MTDFDWKALEDAVLAVLQAQLAYQVNALESYQGDWRLDLKDQSWRLPAVLVMLAGTRAQPVALRSYDLTVDLTLLVVVRQLRGQVVGRLQGAGPTSCWPAFGRPCGTRTWGWRSCPWPWCGKSRCSTTGSFPFTPPITAPGQ